MTKDRDFVLIPKTSVGTPTPGNGVTDSVAMNEAVPNTAVEAYVSIYLETSGAYAVAMGPWDEAAVADHPFSWAWGAAHAAPNGIHLEPMRTKLSTSGYTPTIYTVSTALSAALDSMTVYANGYWEDRLSPYHYRAV